MTRSSSSWQRLAALAAIGWATAGLPARAQTASSTTGAASRPNQLTSETQSGGTVSQPATANNDSSAVKLVAGAAKPAASTAQPAAKPPVTTAAATQRTTYQQAHGTETEPAPAPTNPPANRLFSQYETANRAYVAEPLAPAIVPEAVEAGDGACTNCGPQGGCDQGGCNPCRCQHCCDPYFYSKGWYAGAEYLHRRPNFAVAGAALETSTFVDPNTNASTITDRSVEFDISYDSTFRIFGGYRWGECGEALEFSYWRIDADDAFVSPAASVTQQFVGFAGNVADDPGEILQSDFNMDLDVLDIDYKKRIPVIKGRSSDCGHCCPQWDWAWSLGARIVDFEVNHNNSVLDAAGNMIAVGDVDMQFTGAGPRAGLEGRRYFGGNRKWSAYGIGAFSLLLGDREVAHSRTGGLATNLQVQDLIRTVPVSEIEVGLSRQIGCRTLLSAGYQFQAWWELSHFESIEGLCPSCPADSNILSFDGLFVRLEHNFGAHSRRKCQ
ncbi:MAG: Lpg1974 family pore-forming outer membrane protein [Pirellulales bacterium]